MDRLFHDFEKAHLDGSGPLLASTLLPVPTSKDPERLQNIYRALSSSTLAADIRSGLLAHVNTQVRFPKKAEGNAWVEVYVAYCKAISIIATMGRGAVADHAAVYEAWKDFANVLIKGYTSAGFAAWTVPCLYVAGKYLRLFAIAADAHAHGPKPMSYEDGLQDDIAGSMGQNRTLEDAARVINRIFTLCISDRSPLEESRKWGLYYVTNLLFKTYFRLNSISLCKNILRALSASRGDTPDLSLFPKSHIVTFQYYVGVIFFLEEDYEKAEENLTQAWEACHRDARRNQELILTYLIPCHLLTTHTLPTQKLLAAYPRLQNLFSDLGTSIRRGDLAGFDTALEAGEDEFVKRRIYLTLERGRDIALRNLLRRVYLAAGFEESKDGGPPIRRTRVYVTEFAAALQVGSRTRGTKVDTDEVECILANMIYKNLMKGYIARDRGIVVLSKGSAFPGTGV